MNKDEIKLIEQEIKGCFDYFWYESNALNGDNVGYGLTLDKTSSNISSIAAVGFSLAAYVIGVERKFITYEQGYERVLKTLQTIKKIKHKEGFLPHFVDQQTALNHHSEYSTIDTSILLMGAITASVYFGSEIKEITDFLVDRINWDFLIKDVKGKKQVIMAYSDYFWQDNNGFCPATWDHYAEQLMIYLLYAGSKKTTSEEAINLFKGFNRYSDTYHDKLVIYSFGNPLFIHQFTHCFFDFRNYLDVDGIDWFKNSINATLCNKEYCLEQTWSKTYNNDSWGLSAFQGEHGYRVFGAKPFGFPGIAFKQELDGSVAPYASLSSMVFTPNDSLQALKYFNTIEGLNQKYGLTDSYNFEKEKYISPYYLGIDKGPTIIMLDNYLYQTTWTYFMKNEYIQKAIKNLNFKIKK